MPNHIIHCDDVYLAGLIAQRHGVLVTPKSPEIERLTQEIADFIREQSWQEEIDLKATALYAEIKEANQSPARLPQETATTESNNRSCDTAPASIYTDGACKGNPGPGGWCAILNAPGKPELVLQGGEAETTNNRMEMQAVIAGLDKAGPCRDVTVYTDSQYIANAFNKNWLGNWQRNGWRTAQKKPVLNQDLWQKLADLAKGDGKRDCKFVWVKGHSGNHLNERADEVASAEAEKAGRP